MQRLVESVGILIGSQQVIVGQLILELPIPALLHAADEERGLYQLVGFFFRTLSLIVCDVVLDSLVQAVSVAHPLVPCVPLAIPQRLPL